MPSPFLPTPPQSETPLQSTVSNIKSGGQSTYTLLVRTFERQFNQIWNNNQNTPQDIFTAFGTDAAELFAVAQATIALIQVINPTYVPPTIPSKYTYTIEADGTVTVTTSNS